MNFSGFYKDFLIAISKISQDFSALSQYFFKTSFNTFSGFLDIS